MYCFVLLTHILGLYLCLLAFAMDFYTYIYISLSFSFIVSSNLSASSQIRNDIYRTKENSVYAARHSDENQCRQNIKHPPSCVGEADSEPFYPQQRRDNIEGLFVTARGVLSIARACCSREEISQVTMLAEHLIFSAARVRWHWASVEKEDIGRLLDLFTWNLKSSHLGGFGTLLFEETMTENFGEQTEEGNWGKLSPGRWRSSRNFSLSFEELISSTQK